MLGIVGEILPSEKHKERKHNIAICGMKKNGKRKKERLEIGDFFLVKHTQKKNKREKNSFMGRKETRESFTKLRIEIGMKMIVGV